MKVQTKELLDILTLLKPGLTSGKETTDQSSCFAIKDGMIYTYNDERSVRAKFPIPEASGVIGSKELLNFLSKIKSEEVDLEFSDSELRIKSGEDRAGIRLDQEIHMPIDEIQLPEKWVSAPKDFIKGLSSTIFSTSKDFDTPIITNICCRKGMMESTDNERASRWVMGSDKSFRKELLIPANSAKVLLGYKEVKRYVVDESWVHFEVNDGAVFSSRIDEGDYPQLDDYFEVEGNEFIFPEEIKAILDRASVFVEEDYEQSSLVHVNITEKGVLTIRSESDNGWFERPLRFKNSSKQSVKFSINPQYLLQILSSTNKAVIGESRVLFLADNFLHVVATE